MRRGRVAVLCAFFTIAIQPAIARADVLEIGSGGAHWIAGGHAALEQRPASQLADGPVATSPVLSDGEGYARNVPQVFAAKVGELAVRYDLSPALIEAVVWQESRWQAGARSPVGARGLAQLMPGTARDLGVDPDDPMANLEGGARYLRAQLDRFDGDIEMALAAYNAGPGRVERAGGVPRIRETQSYVAAVIGRLSEQTRR